MEVCQLVSNSTYVMVTTSSVQDEHAVFTVEGGQIYLEKFNSRPTARILHNGESVTQKVEVHHNDRSVIQSIFVSTRKQCEVHQPGDLMPKGPNVVVHILSAIFRLLFGTTQLYMFCHPKERDSSHTQYHPYTFDMAQEEIAANSGFDMKTENKSRGKDTPFRHKFLI